MAKTGPKAELQVGSRIGSWTVVGYDQSRASRGVPWICECVCGTRGRRTASTMRQFPHCQKCRRYVQADLSGQKFGSVTVISKVGMTASGAIWLCRCDCGGEVQRITSNLKRYGNTGCKDCEPLRRALIHLQHGGAFMGKSRLYDIWRGMTKRCRDKTNPHYGAKGITVYDAWLDFKVFRTWAHEHGYANSLTIERMNPNKGYSPANCEWVTRSENSRRVHDPKVSERMAA